MAKIKLITNVGEFGFFRGLAKTRRRLVGSAVAAILLTYLAGIWSAHYVLELSSSVILDFFIITAIMMLLIASSYVAGLVVGDIFFPGPWRQQVVLGHSPHGQVSVADHSAEFLIVVFLIIVANVAGLNWATGGFMSTYQSQGFFRVRLRSSAASERLGALKELADPVNAAVLDKPRLQQAVERVAGDADPRVRRRAVWTLGLMKDRDARPRLIKLLGTDAPVALRQKAAVALGKMGKNPAARRALVAMLAAKKPAALRIAALRGLGLMGSAKSVAAIVPLIDAADQPVAVNALWALRKIGDKRARPKLRQLIDAGHLNLARRCAAFDTMKMVATRADILWARKRFIQTPDHATCHERLWREPDGTRHSIIYGDSFKEKLLKIVANTDAHDHRDWFERIADDPEQPYRIRQVAGEVIRELDRAR